MKRIYFDWNVFTEIKKPSKEPYLSIANAIDDIKDYLIIPYSTAHLADLKKSLKNEESYDKFIKYDLTFLSHISRNFHWYYEAKENKLKWIIKDAIDTFEPYREKAFSIEEIMDFQKILSGIEGMEVIGKTMNELCESIEFSIDLNTMPDDSPLKKTLQDVLMPEGKVSLLSMMKSLAKFYDEIQIDPTKYKELRNGFRKTLNLSKDMSNWKEGTWDKLDNHISSTILNKSFTDLVIDGVNQNNKNKEVTFYDEFIQAYMNLDLVGFNPEDLNKKNTYTNLFNDSQHAFFGAYSDVFVTNDSNTLAKTKVIYDKYGINTEILSPTDFLNKLTIQMEKIELFNTAPNGMKIDYLILTKVPNSDGSDFDYRIEYIDTFDNSQNSFVGTFDLILGCISFEKTDGLGISFGAMKLLSQWIEDNLEE